MKTDRELLSLAAKSFDDSIYEDADIQGTFYLNNYTWNPLTDDGDALRLAVKLKIDIEFAGGVLVIVRPHGFHEDTRDHDCNYCAATRRAIVRAASAIQSAKEST